MSNTKHTPGPWKIAENIAGQIKIFVGENQDLFDYKVASVHGTPTIGQSQANAKLIAAAPELLKILEMTLQDIEHYGELNMRPSSTCINMIKAAIKKATE